MKYLDTTDVRLGIPSLAFAITTETHRELFDQVICITSSE
jgi:hypothetical protein